VSPVCLSTYCDNSYNEVMTWTADTKIKYAPNRKSGKSFHRYGKYMKAKTVGETLALGSFGLDLLFDHEKKLLWAVGGPKRETPPDVLKVDKEALKAMNRTDLMLGRMYCKWKLWKASFKALDDSGMSRKDLAEANDQAQGGLDPEGGKDSILVAIGRRKAQAQAQKILKQVEAEGGRPITDDEVLSCLRLWGFKENTNRGNVTPNGKKFVYSDTVGLIKMSTCERTLVTVGTKRYPEFTRVISKWLKSRLPAELQQSFAFTSVNINKNYAGRLHRDGNNAGPSVIKAFGDFKGGELNYWPSDDKKTALEDFDHKQKVTVNLKDNMLLFDGNRGHYVNPFKGERFSLVFFSVRTWSKVPEAELKKGAKCGITPPSKKTMAVMQGLLGPSGDDGYRVWPAAAGPSKSSKRKAPTASEPKAKRQRAVATPMRGGR